MSPGEPPVQIKKRGERLDYATAVEAAEEAGFEVASRVSDAHGAISLGGVLMEITEEVCIKELPVFDDLLTTSMHS